MPTALRGPGTRFDGGPCRLTSCSWLPPGSPDEALARQVNFEQLPAHIAIIMDGNGRWAAQRHLPRVEGHRAGIDAVRDIVESVGAARHRRADALRVLGRELEAAGEPRSAR